MSDKAAGPSIATPTTSSTAAAAPAFVPPGPAVERQRAAAQISRTMRVWRKAAAPEGAVAPADPGSGEAEAAEGEAGANGAAAGEEATGAEAAGAEAAPPVAAKRVARKIYRTGNDPPAGGSPGPDAGALSALKAAGDGLKQRVEAVQAAKDAPGPTPDSMESSVVIGPFVASARQIYDGWDVFRTPEARVQAMAFAGDDALSAVGVPNVAWAAIDEPESHFRPKFWRIEIGKGQYVTKPATSDKFASVASTVYHEARHAEQNFNCARMLAGQGKTPEEISQAVPDLPNRIAQEAIGKKLAPNDPKVQKYQAILHALTDPATRTLMEDLKTKMAAAGAATMAAIAARNTPDAAAKSTAAKDAWAAAQPAIDAYKALDHEADAFGIEDKVKAAWNR